MATDIFTGSDVSFTDWTDLSAWSLGALPGATDTVSIVDAPGSSPPTGYSSIDFPESYTIEALTLQTGVSLSLSGSLNVQGSDTVTSTGSIVIGSEGSLTDNNAGNTDLVYVQGGIFTDTNLNSDDTANLSDDGTFVFQTNVETDTGGFGNGTFGGVVETMLPGATFDVIDSGGSSTAGFTISGNQVQFNFGGGLESITVNFSFTNMSDLSITTSPTNSSEFVVTVCFCSGTQIRTTRGEVAVEDLAVGDLAVTASGVARPIKWIGHRKVEQPLRAAWPVRVMAGAFGEGLPARDLFLSPGHAVCVDVMDAVFVPVSQLINGATIAQVEVADVTYWHVELESHDVLLAEGMPCESYMDAGNRAFFGREYGRLAEIDPARAAESLARYARPFVDKGPVVAAIRQRLDARAEALRSTQTELRLKVSG